MELFGWTKGTSVKLNHRISNVFQLQHLPAFCRFCCFSICCFLSTGATGWSTSQCSKANGRYLRTSQRGSKGQKLTPRWGILQGFWTYNLFKKIKSKVRYISAPRSTWILLMSIIWPQGKCCITDSSNSLISCDRFVAECLSTTWWASCGAMWSDSSRRGANCLSLLRWFLTFSSLFAECFSSRNSSKEMLASNRHLFSGSMLPATKKAYNYRYIRILLYKASWKAYENPHAFEILDDSVWWQQPWRIHPKITPWGATQ